MAMRIAVVTPDVVEGDAVSNDVLGMFATLKRAGYDVSLGALRTVGVTEPVVKLSELHALLTQPDDLLIYHHSIGSEDTVNVVRGLHCRKILKYHNITPPEFYRDLSPVIAEVCQIGLEQLKPLLQMRPIVWVDSAFNAHDLKNLQPDLHYEVLPPFNQVHRLLQTKLDAISVGPFDDWKTNILVVGRVVPNKNIILAVESFANYFCRFDQQSRLLVVGDIHPEYCRKVVHRIRELHVENHVVITGKVTLPQLKALYQCADLLLCTSKHEGFCLPLIEAMGLNLPIVTVANTALPDTAGEAAWYSKNDSAAIAATIEQCLAQDSEREAKLVAGRERYQRQFRNEAIADRMLQLLKEALIQNSHQSEAITSR